MNQLAGQGWLGEFKWSTNEKEQFRDHSLQVLAQVAANFGGTLLVNQKTHQFKVEGVPKEKEADCALAMEEAALRGGYRVD